MSETFDCIIVGTGFAGSFFLQKFLQSAGSDVRVLVLERGKKDALQWQLENRKHSSYAGATFENPFRAKSWVSNIAFGGGSNCWWACTPRMLPGDFNLRSTHGVGEDWPLSYEDLEPWYAEAEQLMSVSGDDAISKVAPRSTSYPQAPHRLSDADKLLQKHWPDHFFPMPTARARTATGSRPACCATGVCHLCPIAAKFTVMNDFKHLYNDPRVTLKTDHGVSRVIHNQADVATGVVCRKEGGDVVFKGDLIALAAHAIYNPAILHASGLSHPVLGKYLSEQVSKIAIVDLNGVENFQGSTSLTGHGYMFYDHPDRNTRSACLVETSNLPTPRPGRDRWRERLELKFLFEDIPQVENHIEFATDETGVPKTIHRRRSDTAINAMNQTESLAQELVKDIPHERIFIVEKPHGSESHIIGTTRMGADATSNIVDADSRHHTLRNLLVLGSGTFPTGSPANPTLTLSALALRAAARCF
jgi:choline dehydrogenase-like flavoprotein